MAPRTGVLGRGIQKRRGNRVALSGEGSRGGEPPGPEAGARAPSERRPSECCSAAAGGAARPRERGWAHRLGPAGVPEAGGPGPRVGLRGLRGLRRCRRAGSAGGHASGAPPPRARRPRPPAHPPHPAPATGRPSPAETPAPAGRKVTSAGQAAGRAAARVGAAHVLRAVRRRRGRGEGAADAGCCSRGSPPPFAGDSEARRSCGGGTRPAGAQRKPASARLGFRLREREAAQAPAVLQDSYLLSASSVLAGGGRRLDTVANSVSLRMSA